MTGRQIAAQLLHEEAERAARDSRWERLLSAADLARRLTVARVLARDVAGAYEWAVAAELLEWRVQRGLMVRSAAIRARYPELFAGLEPVA